MTEREGINQRNNSRKLLQREEYEFLNSKGPLSMKNTTDENKLPKKHILLKILVYKEKIPQASVKKKWLAYGLLAL